MLGIDADHAHHTLAVDDLAFITHLFYRRSHLHHIVLKVAKPAIPSPPPQQRQNIALATPQY
jgi:hypothetical protein